MLKERPALVPFRTSPAHPLLHVELPGALKKEEVEGGTHTSRETTLFFL